MDPRFGPGPWTTYMYMDPVHGPPIFLTRKKGIISWSLEKAHKLSLNSTRLINTGTINTDNGHFFLAQSTNSHRKLASLIQTHVINCVFLKLYFVKVMKPLIDSMSMSTALTR